VNGKSQHAKPAGPSHTWVEIGVVALTTLFGVIVIIGSLQAGIDWGAEGPRAGFFPFYLGLSIIIASAVNLYHALADRNDALFAEWGQLWQVLLVLAPTTLYVALIPYIGIYVASFVLVAVFMKWLGRYAWPLSLGVPAATIVLVYVMFEKWFLVPLPKGPIEDWLGL
jgi:hypothetical protein